MDFAPAVESENRPDSITTFDQAARLKALLDAENISKVTAIIGSSYGGMTALAFAQNYPDSVSNLCVIGAAHKPCLLYTSPSPRDATLSRMPSSA